MAIQSPLFPNEPGGALTALLSQGVGALNSAINNAIAVGRDRAKIQLGQEGQLFDVLESQKKMELRRAENARSAAESDRLFSRLGKRDARSDFVADRNFSLDVAQEKRAAKSAERTAEHYTTTEQQNARRLELEAIKTASDVSNTSETRKLRTDILERDERLSRDALQHPLFGTLTSPGGARGAPTEELETYADLFGGVKNAEVAGSVSAAHRELFRRNPGIDAATGARVPERYSQNANPFYGTTPEQAEIVKTNLLSELRDIEEAMADPKLKKNNSVYSTLVKQRAALINQLNRGGVDTTGSVTSGDNTPAAPGKKYFQ